MAKRQQFVAAVALCTTLLTPAWADPPTTAIIGTPPQPNWNQLSVDQKVVLAPLGNEWDQMEHVRRKKWLLITERFSKMKPEEQRRVQDRMREWALMTPDQRKKVRDSYKEFAQLPPEQKQAVKQKWETYSSLPEEEKAKAKEAAKASRETADPTGTAQKRSATGEATLAAGTPASEPKKP